MNRRTFIKATAAASAAALFRSLDAEAPLPQAKITYRPDGSQITW